MKGTTFQKPLEFKLRADGETWRQGDAIAGVLDVKNHGVEEVSLADIHVHLALGELKKVRQKSSDAFKIFLSAAFDPKRKLESNKEESLPWTFALDRNCPITDNIGSLFLLYGRGETMETLGHLQLPIQVSPIIEEYLKTIEIDFRFVRKTQKTRKGAGVEVKLAPPSSRGFAMVEQLALSMYFEGEKFHVQYEFGVRKVSATAASVDVTKGTRETEQSFDQDEFLLPSGRINHERFVKAIREALDLVEAKVSF